MKNEFSLDHAKHNEEVCNYLSKNPDYADWVITTAFYAALHYVSYKIFPLTEKRGNGNITYQTFDSYANQSHYASKKHKALTDLVQNHCPSVLDRYNQLKDLSWTARYKKYKQTEPLAKLSQKRMEEIRDYCLK